MKATEVEDGTFTEQQRTTGVFPTTALPLFNSTLENNILFERTSEHFLDEINSMVSSITIKSLFEASGNDSHILMSDVVQRYNVTVFSGYPPELLCVGAICFIVFAVIGILGNLISIVALSSCRRLRNATTAFIVNLCVADLVFCSFSMPLSALMFIQRTWYLGDFLCKLFPLVRYSNGAVSIFSVIAITVNRYVLVVHPKIYPTLYGKRNMVIMIGLMWVISLTILLLPLMEFWGTLGYDPKVGTCTILELNGQSPKMGLNIIAFVLPVVIFVGCYTRIYFTVRKASRRASRRTTIKEVVCRPGTIRFSIKKGWQHRSCMHSEMMQPYPSHHRDRRELRVLRLMLVIFILFIVCYFPISFVKIFNKEEDLKYLNVLGYLGVYFSNIVNPIIYIAMSKEYRRAYAEMFCQSRIKQQTMISQL